MKTAITIIFAGLALLLVVGTADAAISLLKDVKIAEIGRAGDSIEVRRIVDGDVTCYVTRQGQYGAHAISCVK